jgi:hypothetical protein
VESPYPIPTRETLKAKPHRLPYPKRYPKFNHLGKNIELIINKALAEENPEKKQGFANSIAYYMKLAYSNWHKELVHDDAIQSELSAITDGQLEFNNKPFVKHTTGGREGRDDFRRGGGGQNKRHGGGGHFQNRGGRDNNQGRGGKQQFKKKRY